MNEQKFRFALSLAQKAGKLASGDFAVKSSLKKGEAKLLVLAGDAAANSKKDLLYLAGNNGIPVLEALTRDELGQAIGKAKRTAITVLDPGFVKMIEKSKEA